MGSRAGALKAAARRVGLRPEEYAARIAKGQKRCTRCGQWKRREDFGTDASRSDGLDAHCQACKRDRHREAYTPVPEEERRPLGPPRSPRRDGDKVQARSRINHDVRLGLRPDPDELHCARCGHLGSDRRHEYHHHMGYAAEHHYDVLPLCTTCHATEHREANDG